MEVLALIFVSGKVIGLNHLDHLTLEFPANRNLVLKPALVYRLIPVNVHSCAG